MFSKQDQIQGYDDALLAAINQEELRQEEHIELIASENYCSQRVMEAQGSGLTNKYAEGYPGKRYYGGCEYVDKVEQLAIDRAKELFGADYANVQPHSGSSANSAVYLALLNAGDTILGMSLAHGGHLTHGAKVSSSGKLYNAVQYGLNPATGLIDYDEVERLAVEHKPKIIVAGFSAYSKTLDFPRFRAIAEHSGDVVLNVNLAGVIEYASPSALEQMGCAPALLVGQGVTDLADARDREMVRAICQSALAHPGSVHQAEFRPLTALSDLNCCEMVSRAVVDERGQPVGVVSMIRDISRHKARQRALQQVAAVEGEHHDGDRDGRRRLPVGRAPDREHDVGRESQEPEDRGSDGEG